jgi:hypothetical protein
MLIGENRKAGPLGPYAKLQMLRLIDDDGCLALSRLFFAEEAIGGEFVQ